MGTPLGISNQQPGSEFLHAVQNKNALGIDRACLDVKLGKDLQDIGVSACNNYEHSQGRAHFFRLALRVHTSAVKNIVSTFRDVIHELLRLDYRSDTSRDLTAERTSTL
jgi:hypothetical protein